ncbi:MAG: carboxypeptidase regulatory-like domain-containing protein, partial [Blastocatellia bacterium]
PICLSLPFNSARAQAGRAEIIGEVRDQNGSRIGAARVVITEINTGQAVTIIAGADGLFTATNLKPGMYSISVEAVGFRRLMRKGITLATGEHLRIDPALTPGEVADAMTINADAPLLRSETSSLGQVIDNRKIVSLPLNGRSFLSLVSLTPGVAAPPRTSEGPSFPRINGGRPRVNEFLFDGISALQPEPGQIAFFPIVEAIQEFKVEINSPSAEFGRFNGGVVNLTTKSGTNEFHGSAFEFFRNEALNARNLFAPRTAANPNKPVFRRNQFGGVLGGPVIRNKTSFFVDYQGTRQVVGRVRVSSVPTLAQRRGDFSASLGALLYLTPAGTVTTTAGGNTAIHVTDTNGNSSHARQGMIFRPAGNGGADKRAYAGNLIPQSEFDSVARALLSRYPPPTAPGAANNYTRIGNEALNQNQFDARLDHRFSGRDQIFGRYSYARDLSDPVTPLPDGSGALTAGAIGLTKTNARQIVGNYLHVFSQSLLNELRLGHTRRAVRRRAIDRGDAVAIPGIPVNQAFGGVVPAITITGLQQLGPPANTNSDFRTDVTQIFDAVSWLRGRHSIKAGVDFRLQRLDVLQPPSPAGQFIFTSLFTNSQGLAQAGTALASFTGNPAASYLLGQVSGFSIDLQPKPLRPRARILEFFAQDDWKAASRLTVNAGLRYTLNFPSTDADDQGAVFNLQTQQLEYLGRNGFPRTAREAHKLDLGPRLGLAYRLGDRTVLRAGYGLIWQEQAGVTTPFTIPQFPFLQTVSQRTLDNLTPAFRLEQGTTVAPIPLTPDAGLGQGVFAVDRDLGSGYAQQWNLAIQREITHDLVFEAAYAGSKITHVGVPDASINQLTAEQLGQGAPLLERVPNPYFGRIPRSSSLGDPTITRAQLLKPFPRFTAVSLYRNNVGNTNYHALQMKLEQRLARGLSYLISYTRSKLMDDASSVFDATIQTGPVASFPVADSFNRRLERDLSNGDIPNVFTASFTWELTAGKGRALNPSGAARHLARGWAVNGIVNWQSGLPLAVSQATNFNAFGGFGAQRPNLIGRANPPGARRSAARWFNTDAFTTAPQFTLGTASRNPVRGPGLRNLDLALVKLTGITERIDLEFRAEVLNLTNTPPLGNPNVVLGSPGFGSISSAGDPRVIQFGLKLNF